MQHEAVDYQGLLFIGDPHVSALRPGRRKDEDYAATTLGKLGQSLAIARAHGYLPYCLGDLTDKPLVSDLADRARRRSILTQLIRVLMDHDLRVVVGNHDLKETRLTDDTVLSALQEARIIKVIDRPCVYERRVFPSANGPVTVAVCAVPYGYDIPRDIRELEGVSHEVEPVQAGERAILITHHNIDFKDGATYPGAMNPHPIKGCELVVNGHIHLQKPPFRAGRTTWFNPGNIIRQRLDAVDHIPSVWGWTPDEGLKQYVLDHRPKAEVFDFTGHQVKAAAGLPVPQKSLFVELLKASESLESSQTDQGDLLAEEMEQLFQAMSTPEEVQRVVNDLFCLAVQQAQDG